MHVDGNPSALLPRDASRPGKFPPAPASRARALGWRLPALLVLLLVLLLALFASGRASVRAVEEERVNRELGRVARDWKFLRSAIARVGVDWCCQLPLDTSYRGDSRPTFNDDLQAYEALADKGGPPLTTPVAYLDRIPVDPFGGGPYGYLMWSFEHGEPGIYVLHSPGPDGDEDVSLGRLHALVGESFVRFEHEMPFKYTKGSASRARLIVARFQYDPTNGTWSDGDLIHLDASTGVVDYWEGRPIGWAAPTSSNAPEAREFPEASEAEPASPEQDEPPEGWVEEMLRRHPPDSPLPFPRWTGLGLHSASMDPVDYRRFSDILLSDPMDADSPLARIEGELRVFSDYFSRLGAMTGAERSAFAKWRNDGAEWWARVEAESDLSGDLDPRMSAGRRSAVSVEALARLERVRGKSLLLLAADAFARGDLAEGERILGRVERGPVFTGAQWTHAADSFERKAPDAWAEVMRIQGELRRMCGGVAPASPALRNPSVRPQ